MKFFVVVYVNFRDVCCGEQRTTIVECTSNGNLRRNDIRKMWCSLNYSQRRWDRFDKNWRKQKPKTIKIEYSSYLMWHMVFQDFYLFFFQTNAQSFNVSNSNSSIHTICSSFESVQVFSQTHTHAVNSSQMFWLCELSTFARAMWFMNAIGRTTISIIMILLLFETA